MHYGWWVSEVTLTRVARVAALWICAVLGAGACQEEPGKLPVSNDKLLISGCMDSTPNKTLGRSIATKVRSLYSPAPQPEAEIWEAMAEYCANANGDSKLVKHIAASGQSIREVFPSALAVHVDFVACWTVVLDTGETLVFDHRRKKWTSADIDPTAP